MLMCNLLSGFATQTNYDLQPYQRLAVTVPPFHLVYFWIRSKSHSQLKLVCPAENHIYNPSAYRDDGLTEIGSSLFQCRLILGRDLMSVKLKGEVLGGQPPTELFYFIDIFHITFFFLISADTGVFPISPSLPDTTFLSRICLLIRVLLNSILIN